MGQLDVTIPVLPVPRTRAMIVLSNPDATIDELTSVIVGDPSLAAQVIRAANSASSAPVDRVSTPHQSVVRIGLNGVRRLLSAAVMEQQFRRLEDGPIDADEVWRYAIATAVVAETLVTRSEDRPTAFTAGLLHDLGRLALAVTSPSRFAAAMDAVRFGVDPLRAERDQFGTAHTEVGMSIADAWGLPRSLAVVMGLHHEEAMDGLTGAVSVARQAALHAGYADGLTPETTAAPAEPVLAALTRVGGPSGLAAAIRRYRNTLSVSG